MTATAPDHTGRLIRDLDDPEKFVRLDGVEVMQAHERVFADGKKVKVTDADLPGIAAQLNAEIAATGYLMPLTIGHRNFKPDADESKQAKLVGFCKGYRVDWVRTPNGESHLAILEDERVFADQAAALRQYPYRSLDFDIENKTSVGTAMLVRPPFLKMGTTVRYQAGDSAMGDQFDEATDAQPYAEMCEGMKKYAGHKKFRTYLKRYMDAMGPENAGLPAPVGGEPAPAPYQGDATIYAEVAALKSQLAASQATALDARCRQILDPIKGHRRFDYDRELASLKTYADDTARINHVRYIVDTYAELPSGSMIRVYEGPVTIPGAADPLPDVFKEQPRRAEIKAYMYAEIAAGRPCDYDRAKATVLGQK